MGPKKLTVLVLLLFSSLTIITCKHEIPLPLSNNGNGSGGVDSTGNPGPVVTSTCSADSVYFANDILPLINSSCATTGCHDATTHKEGVTLSTYSQISGYVTPFNASNSRLYSVITNNGENSMPPSGPMTASQIAAIQKWINQGALNNQCSGGCDTSVFTYSGAVSVTINTYCKGCHNPASLGGGIDLSNYAGVKAAALGRLMGSINHTTGYSAMPKGGNKLPDCQITQIQKWIQAGTLNN